MAYSKPNELVEICPTESEIDESRNWKKPAFSYVLISLSAKIAEKIISIALLAMFALCQQKFQALAVLHV